MCVMHKEKDYGTITLINKFNKTDNKTSNFSAQLSCILPFNSENIEKSIDELIEINILNFKGDKLICRRMVRDAEKSNNKAKSGSKGGSKKSSNRNKGKSDVDFARESATTSATLSLPLRGSESVARAANENATEHETLLFNKQTKKTKDKFSDFDSETLYPVETLASVYSEDKKLLSAVSKTTGLSEDGIKSFLPEFVLHLNAEGRGKEKSSEFARYFRNKYAASKSNNYTTATQRASADFKWKWSGQATKSGNRREYEADKKNFGQFKFETLKTPNGNE